MPTVGPIDSFPFVNRIVEEFSSCGIIAFFGDEGLFEVDLVTVVEDRRCFALSF